MLLLLYYAYIKLRKCKQKLPYLSYILWRNFIIIPTFDELEGDADEIVIRFMEKFEKFT